jgi:hypothetical protein
MQELIRQIRAWLALKAPLPVLGTVTKADSKTCDVKPLNSGPEIKSVRLYALGDGTPAVLVVPAVGSTVLVGWLDNGHTAYLAAHTQAQRIELNGTEMGGLVDWPKLKAELDKEKQRLTAFLDAYSNATPVANDGGAAIQTAVKAATSALQEANFTNLENELVKHG